MNPQHPGRQYPGPGPQFQGGQYPPSSQPAGADAQPSPSGGGFLTLAGAALLTFAAGMAVLIGYLMIGGFGAFIGIVGAIFGIVWLAGVHGGKVFPREGFPVRSVAGLAAASVVALLLASAMS
ncbi:hypothetical protein LY13_001041 [Prauserella aidingensis]|uniref:hypothetical protein n=1 Tax=Prauserella aidingensis TaxID=387890 RepID=UPI0020A31BBF|nr:hypothetical protein [Prauserella aidingensis]MCP2252302.1 hypothetical protein [Prauserella aidingensis]